ncbi:hypothetical protein FSP39_022882 [Pinctada imbricata]|uniref:Hexosyltransferase n=1 Tax=Pinctada imbricata TaxID=66713 RepID=A0AA88Y9Z6_PINIB|nr:hypothetical protein FSP39_022882 [Pinctada imbricata]
MLTLRNIFWCLSTAAFSCSAILYFSVSKSLNIYLQRLHEGMYANETYLIDGFTRRALYWNNKSAVKSNLFTSSSEVYVSGNTSKDWCSGLSRLYPLILNFSNTRALPKHYGPINNVSLGYKLEPKNICNRKRRIYILSIVKSRVNNFKLRQAIRKTWGKRPSNRRNVLIFTLGLSSDEVVQKLVRREFSTYGDILQGNFIDNYYNNTIKTTMEIRWAGRICKHSRFVLLVDDDVIVNFQNLETHVSQITEDKENNLFSGNLKNLDGPMRNKNAKWYMSKYRFPYTCYPPYISGGAILTSGKVISRISEALPFVKRFRYDDVYLGIIVQKLGIKPQRNVQVSMRKLKADKLRTFIASHGFKNAKEYLATYRNFTL